MSLTRRVEALTEDMVDLQAHLEVGLTARAGKRRRVVGIDRRLSPFTSSFRIDELDVRVDDGSTLRLILKDLSRRAMVESARRARPEFLYQPRREINAYDAILPQAPVGTPVCYASVADKAGGRYWLLLERVAGLQLKYVGDLAAWERTAAWIARFHGSFPPLEARRLGVRAGAVVYDEEFYWRWLERARRFGHRDRDRRRVLAGVARHYKPLVERLTRLPQALIHGEFYPSNVIIAKGAKARRVCPVDWELLAIGPALVDLAALTAGWPQATQRTLARAYLAATRDADTAKPVRLSREFMIDLDCCRLYLAVRMLGWSDDWQPPQEQAHDWLAEADRLSRRLGAL
jgi:aminoglycoside phosphotransferase (APT) family kinase protein